jgi:hypothetical protein
MNTTTTKIAGEAMTDEQIIEMAKAHCVDATRISTVLSFARALLASQAAVLQKPYGWVGAGNYWTADELTAKQVIIRTDTPMVPVYVATTAPAQSCGDAEQADETVMDDAQDAVRYRWLRDPKNDVAKVIDKVSGEMPYDEGTRTGGYLMYEYRSGEELDSAIDAARAKDSK